MSLIFTYILMSVIVTLTTEIWNEVSSQYLVWACGEVPGLLEFPKGTYWLPNKCDRLPEQNCGQFDNVHKFGTTRQHGWNERLSTEKVTAEDLAAVGKDFSDATGILPEGTKLRSECEAKRCFYTDPFRCQNDQGWAYMKNGYSQPCDCECHGEQ